MPPRDKPLTRPVCYFTLQNGGRRSVTFTPAHRDRLMALTSSAIFAVGSVRVHAFSLTTSDIRMVVEGGEPSRRAFVRELSAQHRLLVHGELCGADCLFERPYQETAVGTERDLLDVVAHIHAAPLRAGLVSREVDYPWSSAAAYEGAAWFAWLTTELIDGLRASRKIVAPARRAPISEPAEASRPQF